MADHVTLPIKLVRGERWAELSAFGPQQAHEICGEKVWRKDENYSFAGNHRVRLYGFKKNVHWKVPSDVILDIAGVQPPNPPRRQAGR